MSDTIPSVAQMQRLVGEQTFRLAAARMLKKFGFPVLASEVLTLKVEHYLTPEEIAERYRLP